MKSTLLYICSTYLSPPVPTFMSMFSSSVRTDQHLLTELEKERLLFFTPSRQFRGRRLVCHDDRYILNLAAETGAVVVSNDNYRDLINDKEGFKKVIEEKILMYSFVNDRYVEIIFFPVYCSSTLTGGLGLGMVYFPNG